jgi:hypothetical protein
VEAREHESNRGIMTGCLVIHVEKVTL